MRLPSRFPHCASALMAGMLGLTLSCGGRPSMSSGESSSPRRDINAVLAEHDKQLLAKPGVVGVYVGLLDDGKTPCLRVMLARPDQALERSIPRMLEGWPVATEVTGEIKPLAP